MKLVFLFQLMEQKNFMMRAEYFQMVEEVMI